MTITKQGVADKIAEYLRHQITLPQLVDWSENTLMEGELAESDAKILSSVLSRLGAANMPNFELFWDDYAEILRTLGFATRVEVLPT